MENVKGIEVDLRVRMGERRPTAVSTCTTRRCRIDSDPDSTEGSKSIRMHRFSHSSRSWFSRVRSTVAASPWVLFSLWNLCAHAAALPTPVVPVWNEYHGTRVLDPYQWLEQTDSPAVTQWTDAQNRLAREHLDRIPTRDFLQKELGKLVQNSGSNYHGLKVAGGRIFALKLAPPAQQPVLVTLASMEHPLGERVVVDPADLDKKGGTSIDFYEPSPDGKTVAVSLSEHGSESGTLHVFDTADGRHWMDRIPRAQFATAGGSVAWRGDGLGFYYSRYPHEGERPAADLPFYQQVYFHALGTENAADRYEVGREFPRIAEIQLQAQPGGDHVLATVLDGDGGDRSLWLRDPDGRWRQIARSEDQIEQGAFGRDPYYIEWPRDEALYLLSRKGAPKGKVLRWPLKASSVQEAREIIAEGRRSITRVVPSSTGLYLAEIDGGPMNLRFVDRRATLAEAVDPGETNAPSAQATAGANDAASRDSDAARRPRRQWSVPVNALHSISELVVHQGDELLFRSEGYLEPYSWQRYDPAKDRNRPVNTALRGVPGTDFSDVEAVRLTARSKDGTLVPMTLLQRKGLRQTGNEPTILTGYGGYGISIVPAYQLRRRAWLDQGGRVAIANLRGGGEFGDRWHRDGNLTRKQTVFDDFIACAEFLIRSNYTSSAKLAIEGGSNGGLLMGAALTQRPELFRAVVAHVGLYDMLRVERDPNGEFNTTEFGSVKSSEQFDALLAYSPYHAVRDRVAYPSVLFMTGAHDGRVNPAHSRKMTARLQAASVSKRPILLRTSNSTGHGQGTPLNARIAQWVDVDAFLWEQLGVTPSLVSRGPWAGAVTTSSAQVKARLYQEGKPVQLRVSTNPDLRGGMRFQSSSPASEAGHNLVDFKLKGLRPDTQYYYSIETGRALDVQKGSFRTFPEKPVSFSFAYGSCARTASTSEIFDTIRDLRPLFFMNVGDFHYLDITNREVARFRAAYDWVLASPQQSDLYRSTAFVYMWDDHDFGGNNSNRRASSHQAARAAYDEYVPHYPLIAGGEEGPIYQTFSVGRTKFIITDLRSERDSVTNRDDAAKSIMGAQQKAWFKQELLSARGKFPLIFWVSTVPWLGEKGSNYYKIETNLFGYIHHSQLTNTPAARTNRNRGGAGAAPADTGEDHWSVFATERREIADFIKANHIEGVAILHGDSHMLAADDGSHSDFATGGGARIPVMCAAPLDQSPSIKGGPYSQGVYRMSRGEGGFGWVTVTDSGSHMNVVFSGRNQRNEEKISLRFSVPASKVTK